MSGCLFCAIVKKEIPAEVIYENEGALGFLDINPMSPGHTLVIPKGHASSVLDLPEEDFAYILKAIREVERMALKSLKPDGFTLGINQGKVSGQEVDHLHVHIAPRFLVDGGGSFQKVVNNKPKESIKEIAEKLKA